MQAKGPGFSKFKSRPRKAVRLSEEELVKKAFLEESCDQELPLVIEPNVENVNLAAWAASHRDKIVEDLHRYGAILFRNFDIDSADRFQEVTHAICPDLLEYRERAAPRLEVGKNVYTSTEFPADQTIPMHHEMSYSHNWPQKIFFYCDQPPESGGRTPIADDRKVICLLDKDLKKRFLEKKIMYVRNYGEGVDLTWQEAFQTDDKQEVEEYCRSRQIEAEWRGEERLRTRTRGELLAVHPETGDTLWFNHAHMFHMSNLTPAVREALLSEFRPEEFPRNVFFSDGSPIKSADLEHVRQVYEDTAVRFTWQKGDILLVDNFLVSHGREPFTGKRKILVAMAELYTNPKLVPAS